MKDSILNYEYIEEFITTNLGEDVKYRWSHGATKRHIGDGLIIYTLINFFKLKTLVCLGSGGGFIPRIMTQARYDLSLEGFYEEISMEWGDNGSTYIVDACNGFNGEVDWEKEDSVFRKHFTPKFIKETTEKAYYDYFVKQDIKIDYLHIDADHTFEGCKKDFDLYIDNFQNINEIDRAGWVCGLGHGILKETPEENVHYFIENIRKIFS